MATANTLHIAVLPGDGIGREVMAPALAALDRLAAKVGALAFRFETLEAGAAVYRDTGTALPDEVITRAGAADAMLLGAMGLPDIRYPDGREIAPQVDLREIFNLFAGVRPVRTFAGGPAILADERARNLDFVLIREQTEGLFAGRGKARRDGDEAVHETLTISRAGSERLFDFAFNLARSRRQHGRGTGRVTCVDKANILASFAFFRAVFDERAAAFADISADHCHVDAMAMHMVRAPWQFDVLVTENMFGDILSDLAAGLMGGMGFAPSADIGADHGLFQPCHGTAPDIAGAGKANPTAMLLSAAMMLDWLGERHGDDRLAEAARRLDHAVLDAFAPGDLVPFEVGGAAGLKEITERVLARI